MIQFQNEEFTVFQSELYKTTSVVIQTQDLLLIVDPNLLSSEIQMIRDHVNEVKRDRPLYLLFTHSDWDHIVGYGAFQEAIVIANQQLKNRTDKIEILTQISDFDNQYYIDRNYPILYPSVDLSIEEDGQVLQIGNTILTFYNADGHTNDGLYTIIEPLGIWIVGDYLSDFEFPFIYSGSKEYEETLRKTDIILANHKINYLIPGHGLMAKTHEEIITRKEKSLQYIQELRKNIKANRESEYLINDYQYRNGQVESHEGNVLLIKKELENN